MWQSIKPFTLLALSLSLLASSFGPFYALNVNAQENPSGNVSFQPNIIESVSVHFVKEYFRFQWLDNRFDLKLSIGYNETDGTIKPHTLGDFWEKTDMKLKEVLERASIIEFGYNITDIPQEHADRVLYLVWKIEDSNFPIEVEEINSFLDLGYNITRFHMPNEIFLSYEDLWSYNFTVTHPDKYTTKIGNVQGKTSWNLDPVVHAGGVITITNYDTEGTACDLDEIHTQIADESIFDKVADNGFVSDARIVVGNGTGTTWLKDSYATLIFNDTATSANYQAEIEVKANAKLKYGVLTGATNKRTRGGVQQRSESTNYFVNPIAAASSTSDVYLYGCHFAAVNGRSSRFGALGGEEIYEISFQDVEAYIQGSTVSRMTISNPADYGLLYSSGTFEDVLIHGTDYALGWGSGALSGDITGLKSRNCTYVVRQINNNNDRNLINPDVDSWTFLYTGTNAGDIYRQYIFDLTVTTAANNPIENANVTLTYYGQGGGTHGTWLTDVNGEIPEQTVTAGFYNQTGGNTIYDYNPYEITITHADYLTYQRNFTQLEAKSWNIALLEEPVNWIGLTLFIGLLCVVACVYALTTKD